MSDSKSLYSQSASIYINSQVSQNPADKLFYEKSKRRESKHNNEWLKHLVNLNDIIAKFAPNPITSTVNGKFIFKSQDGRYNIVTDMVAGYLRIYDNKLKKYVKLDGTPGNEKATHYKIKKSKEM